MDSGICLFIYVDLWQYQDQLFFKKKGQILQWEFNNETKYKKKIIIIYLNRLMYRFIVLLDIYLIMNMIKIKILLQLMMILDLFQNQKRIIFSY